MLLLVRTQNKSSKMKSKWVKRSSQTVTETSQLKEYDFFPFLSLLLTADKILSNCKGVVLEHPPAPYTLIERSILV